MTDKRCPYCQHLRPAHTFTHPTNPRMCGSCIDARRPAHRRSARDAFGRDTSERNSAEQRQRNERLNAGRSSHIATSEDA